MSFYTFVKLVVTIAILAIAFSPPNQLLSELFANTFENQNHASAERMEATVVQKIEPQVHLKESREKRQVGDDRIDLSTEGPHVRTRRQIEKNPSSVNKDTCGVDPHVHERLENVKNLVKTTRENRKEIEQKLLDVLKERNELVRGAMERNTTSGKIKVCTHVIKKIEKKGNAQLQSEKKKANDEVSALQNEIERLNANRISDVRLTELRTQLKRAISDIAVQNLTNDDMDKKRIFAESQKQVAIQRNEACAKLSKDLKTLQSNFDGNDALNFKRNDIGNLDGLLSDKRNCCGEKGCDDSSP